MKNILTYIILLSSFALILSCKEEEEIQPDESFLKIYNDETFENVFTPVDFVQGSDSSYFILGSYDINNAYVMKVDKEGNFEWDFKLNEEDVNPIPGIVEKNNTYYFFCMDELTLNTKLYRVSDSSSSPQLQNSYNISFPLCASKTSSGGMIMLSYDFDNQESRLNEFDANFNLTNADADGFPVMEDFLELIDGHINGTGNKMPFFTGESDSRYYFNGYSDYTLSIHFLDKNTYGLTGKINGFQKGEEAVSGLLNIGSNEYFLTRYSYNENFIIPSEPINEGNIFTSTDFPGNDHPEITQRAFFDMKEINVNGTPSVVVGTTTKTNQIILYFYNPNSGELQGSRRLGFNNPYSLVKVIQSLDGGLAILGNTYVTGRFSRISIYKISQKELIDIISE